MNIPLSKYINLLLQLFRVNNYQKVFKWNKKVKTIQGEKFMKKKKKLKISTKIRSENKNGTRIVRLSIRKKR